MSKKSKPKSTIPSLGVGQFRISGAASRLAVELNGKFQVSLQGETVNIELVITEPDNKETRLTSMAQIYARQKALKRVAAATTPEVFDKMSYLLKRVARPLGHGKSDSTILDVVPEITNLVIKEELKTTKSFNSFIEGLIGKETDPIKVRALLMLMASKKDYLALNKEESYFRPQKDDEVLPTGNDGEDKSAQ